MAHVDDDLAAIQAARDLAVAAREAQRRFQFTSQEDVDRICEAMVEAVEREAERLGQLAHDETGFGFPVHKKIKNEFASRGVWESIKDTPTCGVLRHDEENKVLEIGAPVGVLVALTPSTNPTSTAIFKILIGVKARNAVIVTPHPSATKCTAEAVRVMAEAGERAGMPSGLVSCVTKVTLPATQELMNHYTTSMILATGGPGMVKAAHSCGKPALGVGPGNVPAYVDRSAHIAKAAQMIVESKSFDCSTICATEQAVLADREIADRLKEEMQRHGAHWLSKEEADKLAALMFRANGMMNATLVGRTPQYLGAQAGIDVPKDARILVAELGGIGPKFPLSREKLTTVLGWMVVDDWRDGAERATELLRFGGDGHSCVIHSRDEESILGFGLKEPAFRILVNTWGSLGGVGYTTGIKPSLTLAPGGVGGAVVSDNITVTHVLNTRRVAYHLTDAPNTAREWGAKAQAQAGSSPTGAGDSAQAETIERIVSKVLAEMGVR